MGTRDKKIIELVLVKKAELAKQEKAEENKKMAIAAVTGGLGSAAWKTYMKQFVSNDDPDQLKRLFATDDTGDDQNMIERRAYLVADGVCGEGTKELFGNNVNTIDDGIQ